MIKIKLILLICLSVILFGCNNSNSSSSQSSSSQEEQTKIFNISSYDITVGDNIQLEYNAPEGALVSFLSNDITVAEVTDAGLVSAKRQGLAVIEITLVISGITKKDTCTINVSDKDITFIDYQNESITLEVNEKITPALTVQPSDIDSSGISLQTLQMLMHMEL